MAGMWSGLLALLLLAVPFVQAQEAYGDELDAGSYGDRAAGEAPAPVVCSGECVGTYKKCSGKNIDTQLPCCSEDNQCVFKNSFYSQCRPKSKGIPVGWPLGMVLEECTGTTVCDDGEVTFNYETASIRESASGIVFSITNTEEIDCRTICVEFDDECVMYALTASKTCILYDANAISKESIARPWDRPEGRPSLTGVKCFYPELCEASTVKEVDKNGEFFFFGRADFDNTKIQVGSGRADIVTDCANLCAMSIPIEQLEGGDPHDICTGFAIDGDLCTLLYPGRTATAEKPGVGTPFIVADNTRVYNIEECIAEPEVCEDDSAISFKYETAELLFKEDDLEIDFLPGLDEEECKTACLNNQECVMYEWIDSYIFKGSGDTPIRKKCWLYDDTAFPNRTQIRPFAEYFEPVLGTESPGTTVAGVKCYYPPEVCSIFDIRKQFQVETKEYFTSDDGRFDDTKIQLGPGRQKYNFRDRLVIDCANICALGFREEQIEGGDAGVCDGFAIDGDVCTLLYPEGPLTKPFVPGNTREVYSIEQCLIDL